MTSCALSVNVLQSTFHSMAEAVLVIDAEGTVLLSNPAAERILLHRAGMSLRNLRALSDVFHGDGVYAAQGGRTALDARAARRAVRESGDDRPPA